MRVVRFKPLVGALILVIGIVVSYLPALQGGYIWDDDLYVSNNTNIRSADGLVRIWTEPAASPQYYPLVFTSFWLEYQLWQAAPFGYHATNVLLHISNTLLLWVILNRLSVPGAWLAAACFGLHPVHVESVAWITERKNVLSGLFYLLAILTWLGFSRLPAGEHKEASAFEASVKKRWAAYPLVVLFFICALLSKSVTATLPATLLLLVWWKRGRIERGDIVPVVPMAAIGVAAGLVTAWIEKYHVGAMGNDWALSPVERILIAGRVPWFYAGKLLWPESLSFVYPRWQVDAGDWWQYLFPLGTLIGVLTLWRLRGKMGRGPLTAALYFVGALAPVLGFFNVYPMRFSWVADHFQYLASIGPITLFAAMLLTGVGRLLAGLPSERVRTGAIAALFALILSPLSLLTWQQTGIYRNMESLWRDTLNKNPLTWLAHNNLGRLLHAQGKIDEAVLHYNEALRLEPDEALILNNLGIALATKGNVEEAILHYRTARDLLPAYPNTFNNLGLALLSQGKSLEAIDAFSEALRLQPAYADAHFGLAKALLSAGRSEESATHFRRAIGINPDHVRALYNHAFDLFNKNKIDEAILCYREVVRAAPNHLQAYNNLGTALTAQSQFREATEVYRRALQFAPKFPDAYLGLGVVSSRQSDWDGAERYFSEALRLKPDFAAAHFNLGVALEMKGISDGAIRHFQEAVRLAPTDGAARYRLRRALQRAGQSVDNKSQGVFP